MKLTKIIAVSKEFLSQPKCERIIEALQNDKNLPVWAKDYLATNKNYVF